MHSDALSESHVLKIDPGLSDSRVATTHATFRKLHSFGDFKSVVHFTCGSCIEVFEAKVPMGFKSNQHVCCGTSQNELLQFYSLNLCTFSCTVIDLMNICENDTTIKRDVYQNTEENVQEKTKFSFIKEQLHIDYETYPDTFHDKDALNRIYYSCEGIVQNYHVCNFAS